MSVLYSRGGGCVPLCGHLLEAEVAQCGEFVCGGVGVINCVDCSKCFCFEKIKRCIMFLEVGGCRFCIAV